MSYIYLVFFGHMGTRQASISTFNINNGNGAYELIGHINRVK